MSALISGTNDKYETKQNSTRKSANNLNLHLIIISAESMTWIFDKKILSNSGFSIDPEKIEKLPGLTR